MNGIDKCGGKEVGDLPLAPADLACRKAGPSAQLQDAFERGLADRFKLVRTVPDDEIIVLLVFGHAQMIQLRHEICQQKWAFKVRKEGR